MNTQGKILEISNEDNEKRKIVVTHLTIRQSISILLLRLFILEALAALGIILFHVFVISTSTTDILRNTNPSISLFNVPLFILLVFIKTFLMFFIIIQWLEEYYEVTPKEIVHRRGLFFRKEERNRLEHLGSLEIDQGLLGRVFNYGTIKLFNWATEKDIMLYLIHNPMKYYHVMRTLLPEVDRGKKIIREHVFEPEEI